jgi:hypothetical protein
MKRLTTVWTALAALTFTGWLGLRTARAGEDDSLIPSELNRDQQQNVKKFLSSLAKPKRLIPEGSQAVGFAALSPEMTREGTIREHLTAIIPERPTAAQPEPRRAEVFWYRYNPIKGKPGVTVKRVVDLSSGKQVGQTEVFADYPTPLARAEVKEAIQLAGEKSEKVKAFYRRADSSNVRVEELLAEYGAGAPGFAGSGDRVVNLQFLDVTVPGFVSVEVNLTRGTVADTDKSDDER